MTIAGRLVGSKKVAEPHFPGSLLCRLGVSKSALVLLALSLAGLPAHALGPRAPFTPPAAVAGPPVPAAPATRVSTDAPTIDPSSSATTPEAVSAAATTAMSGLAGLSGLRLGKTPMALIDGQWWRPGDRPRGALLAAVQPGGALLRHADGRIEQLAWLGESSVVNRVGAASPQPRPSPSAGPQPMKMPR